MTKVYTDDELNDLPVPNYGSPKKIGEGGAIILKVECECGKWFPEHKKVCPHCQRVNPEWLERRARMGFRVGKRS